MLRVYRPLLGENQETKKSSNEERAVDGNRITGTLGSSRLSRSTRSRSTRGTRSNRAVTSRATTDGLSKSRESNGCFLVRVSDVHTGGDIQDVLVSLLDFGVVLHEEVHGHVVDFVRQDDVTGASESTVRTHLDEGFIVIIDSLGGDTSNSVGSPIVGIQVPKNSSQVQLSGDPTNTVINITLGL